MSPAPCGHPGEAVYVTKRGRQGCRECDSAARRSRPKPEPESAPSDPPVPPGAVAALALDLAQRAVNAAPELSLDRFADSLNAWATAEAVAHLIRQRIDAAGPFTERGQPRASLLFAHNAAERTAERLRDGLGLTPRSAAAIITAVRAGGVGLLSSPERERLGVR